MPIQRCGGWKSIDFIRKDLLERCVKYVFGIFLLSQKLRHAGLDAEMAGFAAGFKTGTAWLHDEGILFFVSLHPL